MIDYCRSYHKNTECEPEILQEATTDTCPPFDVCLPFGRSLHFDGRCMSVKGQSTVPDGEYGVIVVEDGCIVDARPNPVFEYTPPPCSPTPATCDGEGGTGVTLMLDSCNLLQQDAAGRLGAFLNVEAGSGITMKGCGSASEPLVITAAPAEAEKTYVTPGSATNVTVSGTGAVSNPYVIDLAETGIQPGTYSGLRIDAYGRVVGTSTVENSSITSIVEGPGISVNIQSGIATVSLAEVTSIESGNYTLGGYDIEVDLAGRITGIRQAIDIEEGTYDPHDVNLTVNGLGSITDITPIIRQACNHNAVHSNANSDARLNITTDARGHLYAEWHGWEVIYTSQNSGTTSEPPVSDSVIGIYTNVVNNYIEGRIQGDGITRDSFGSITGKFAKRTITSTSGTQSTSYTEIAVVEWRGISTNTYNAGTYTVIVSKPEVNDVIPPYANASVLEVKLIQP